MIYSGLWGKGNIGVNRNETTSSSRKSYISSKSACRQSSGCSAWVRLQRSGWKVAVWFQVSPQRYPTSEGAQPLLQPSSPNNEVFFSFKPRKFALMIQGTVKNWIRVLQLDMKVSYTSAKPFWPALSCFKPGGPTPWQESVAFLILRIY